MPDPAEMIEPPETTETSIPETAPETSSDPTAGMRAELAAKAAELETARREAADAVAKAADLETKLAAEMEAKKQLEVQLNQLKERETARLQSELAALSPEDKALVTGLAGEDAAMQFKVLEQLRSAGKIGAAAGPSVPQSRIAGSEDAPQGPPKDINEAADRTRVQIQEAIKKSEAQTA